MTKDGPDLFHVGIEATYFVLVENDTVTGDGSPIGSVDVDDPMVNLTLFANGDGDNLLEQGETWVYQGTYTPLVTDDNPLENTATANGVDGDEGGGDPVPEAESTYSAPLDFDANLQIEINGPVVASVDQVVTFDYEVSTGGNSATVHQPIVVTDSIAGVAQLILKGGDGDDLLEQGEIWLFRAQYTIQPTDPDPLISTANASGLDGGGSPVTAVDLHIINITPDPRLAISKTGPAVAKVGDVAVFTYTVTHSPASDETPINTITVEDDYAGTATFVSGDTLIVNGELDFGESWVYTAAYTIPSR